MHGPEDDWIVFYKRNTVTDSGYVTVLDVSAWEKLQLKAKAHAFNPLLIFIPEAYEYELNFLMGKEISW